MQERFRVEVWFGEHKIIEHDSLDPRDAASFEQAMCRRWPSLLVTNQPVVVADERSPQ
jgi:hypothetical protein